MTDPAAQSRIFLVVVDETEDGLRISPAALSGGLFHTYADHRMVMAGALLGLRVPGLLVEDVGTVAKTMPDFVPLWEQLLVADRDAARTGASKHESTRMSWLA